MTKVLFFAQLRDVLDTTELDVQEPVKNVGELRGLLQQRSSLWEEQLVNDKCLVAVNHTICDDNTPLNADDEVAFFPPVTGG